MSPAPISRSFFHRHWRRLTLLTALATTLTVCGLALWSGWKLAGPARRPLQDYHHDSLRHPEAHGLKIEPFTTWMLTNLAAL